MVLSNPNGLKPSERALSHSAIKALLVMQFLLVLPFLQYLPLWLGVVFVLVTLWRLKVVKGLFKVPPRWLTLSAMAIGVLGLVFSGLNQYSLESAVSLCVLGYLLKSLEVLRRRDGVFQVYLGYFLVGVYLLFRFDPIAALLMVLLLMLNTFALYAVISGPQLRMGYGFKQTTFMVAGAIPVMLVCYLFFPRLPPLWQIPNDQRGSVTGMTDEITPGSVADLAQSTAPAFRVQFDDERPPRAQWYWRGNTLGAFDGQSWRSEFTAQNQNIWPNNAQLPTALNNDYSYQVTLEASGQHWLYFLDWPTRINASGVQVLPDARAAARTPHFSHYRYEASSASSVKWPRDSSLIERYTKLPSTGNESLKQWAISLSSRSSNAHEFAAALAAHVRSEPFYYTLKPPLYRGDDALSDFWFSNRRGFCSHYASASAFALRAAGIPARLVGGYLGGIFNENGGYIQVRQMEAHVWVEYWADDQWHRFDPTAAVSPSRVEQNLDALFSGSQSSDLPLLARVGRLSAFSQLSLSWDALVYRWQTTVLDYESTSALAWFDQTFNGVSPLKLAILFVLVLGGGGLVLALALGLVSLPKRPPEPYRSLINIERRYGARLAGETISQYFKRIKKHSAQPELINDIEQAITAILYGPNESGTQPPLKAYLKQLKK